MNYWRRIKDWLKPPRIIFIFISKAVSLRKYISDHLTFNWRVYFSRPIRFSCMLVCGPFKNLWFSCRWYFKVPLPILLAASPLACQNFILRTLTIPPACQNFISHTLTIPPATQANLKYLFPLFQWHACNLAKLAACIAKCMSTINEIIMRFTITNP